MTQVARKKSRTEVLSVASEYGTLELVIVHRPGPEIDRLTTSNRETLLFEDIPYLPRMQEEHDAFVKELRHNRIDVLYLEELLREILSDDQVCQKLVMQVCAAYLQPSLASAILDHYDRDQITQLLLYGVTTAEIREATGLRLTPTEDYSDPFLIGPAPNAYFMRDPAAVISDSVVSCKMHYPARVQESLIVREIFRHHPWFRGTSFLFGDSGPEDRPYTVEGGDILVLSNKAVAVGRSERTRSETIAMLARRLFQEGKAQRVYEIDIPARREYMHLDTVFTIVDQGIVVAYPGVMEHVTEVRRYEPLPVKTDQGDQIIAIPIEEKRRFNTILEEEFGGNLLVIHTGNNDRRYADREQRADGTNVFAIAPSKVITYERNTHSNRALRANGITTIEIEGSELVRGLGGPRCMTMPLRRRPAQESAS